MNKNNLDKLRNKVIFQKKNYKNYIMKKLLKLKQYKLCNKK